MKKRYILGIIFGILIIATVIAIFSFSSENGTESGGRSDKVIDILAHIFIRDYENMSASEKAAIVRRFAYPVRKGAHIAEYAMLSAFVAVFIWVFTSKSIFTLTLPVIISFALAMSDELILQRSTAGRSGKFSDVLIDLIGMVIGTVAVYAFMKFYWRGKRRKRNENKQA